MVPPVGRNMEVARKRAGLSAAEAARRIGVQPLTFYRWRDGHSVPGWDNVVKAAEVFGVTPDWFYREEA